MRTVLYAFAILTACWCRADEKMSPLNTALSSTVIAGYVSTSVEFNFEPDVQVVPEPSASALLAAGGAAIGLVMRRRKRRG